jgi:hypothetical protein
VRFPLRRQQQDEVEAGDQAAPPSAEPIPFPPPADAHAGSWEELLRTRTAPRVDFPLKGQMTGSDARAERLVRQVRQDVERLQATLTQLASEQSDLYEVDAASVAANPDAALTLPPAVLVRALIASDQENRTLRKRIGKSRIREQKLREKLHRMELDEASRKSRLDTLEEVLAALHGNLQDLRAEREYLRQQHAPQLPPGGDR